MKECKYLHKRGGQGLDGWISPCCDCGWESGTKHYAHNDYQHSNAREQWERHVWKEKNRLMEGRK